MSVWGVPLVLAAERISAAGDIARVNAALRVMISAQTAVSSVDLYSGVNLFDPDDYTIAIISGRNAYISGSNSKLSNGTVVTARSIVLPAVGGATYYIRKSTATTVRVGAYAALNNQEPPLGVVINTSPSSDPITITAGTGANYLVIQLFVDADADDLRSIEANIGDLVVAKVINTTAITIPTPPGSITSGYIDIDSTGAVLTDTSGGTPATYALSVAPFPLVYPGKSCYWADKGSVKLTISK